MKARDVFDGSDGKLTNWYYNILNCRGPIGLIATAVFRAEKCSQRAKVYRKGSWKHDAYDRKTWSIGELVKICTEHATTIGITWGWKEDPNVLFDDRASFVFYIDLPTGQVSFHCRQRGEGIDYAGQWDGVKGASIKRILKFCDQVFEKAYAEEKKDS